MSSFEIIDIQKNLLTWYRKNKRDLPWRHKEMSTPYHVWLSEIMLQQTTVTAVIPYFLKFIEKWPDIESLANSELDEVLTYWAGLGYYSRARNLHKCAKLIVLDYKGQFPGEVEALQKLPGIGPYTASAISSIAFNKPVAAVDGNVERVMARFYAITEFLPMAKKILKEHAEMIVFKNTSPPDFTQALMELGALICTPKSPKCSLCPWHQECKGARQGIEASLPKRLSKTKKPLRKAVAFWVEDPDTKRFLLRQRPEEGLLGGMLELPSTPWIEGEAPDNIEEYLPVKTHSFNKKQVIGLIKHVFTHFNLELEILPVRLNNIKIPSTYIWVQESELNKHPIPSVTLKAIRYGLKHYNVKRSG